MRFELYSLCWCYVIDDDGYRANVGIILSNLKGRVFWCRRIGFNAWQFPQGGINAHETAKQAMYRELKEEVGLSSGHVEIIGVTRRWLRYQLPSRLIRRTVEPVCIGQKQKWFILRFLGDDSLIRLDNCAEPEFDRWKWVDYWHPIKHIVEFKRDVYKEALAELEPLLYVVAGTKTRVDGLSSQQD